MSTRDGTGMVGTLFPLNSGRGMARQATDSRDGSAGRTSPPSGPDLAAITSTRSAIGDPRAKRSWVITIMAVLNSRALLQLVHQAGIWACMVTSNAVVGSSAMSSCGIAG